MIVSAICIAAGVGILVMFAAMRQGSLTMAYAHMGVAAVVTVGFAAAYFRRHTELRAAGARPSAIAATTARFIGYIWTWGAGVLLATYATGILVWREWPHFTIGTVLLAAVCLLFAGMLQRDADAGKDDPALLKAAHWGGIVLLVGMIAVIVGFVIDGKMQRITNPRFADWAANNVFFFGAIALAAISGYALKFKQQQG